MKTTGRGLENAVIATARLYGWRIHHVRPARTARGWRTPISGDPGFVDFVLCRPPRCLVIESKSGSARLSADQRAWRDALVGCPGVEYHLVTDAMLDDDGDGNALTRLLR